MSPETSFIVFLVLAVLLILAISTVLAFADGEGDYETTTPPSRFCLNCTCFTLYGGLIFAIVWGSVVMHEANMSPPIEVGGGSEGEVGFTVVLVCSIFATWVLLSFTCVFCINTPSLCPIICVLLPGLFVLSLANNRLATATEYSEMTMLSTGFSVEYHEYITSPEFHESHGYIGRQKVEWGHSWACPQEPSLWCTGRITEQDCTVATHKVNRNNGKLGSIDRVRDDLEAMRMVNECLETKTLYDVSQETGAIVDLVMAFGNCPSDPSDCDVQTWIPDEMSRSMLQTGQGMLISGAALIGILILYSTCKWVKGELADRSSKSGEETTAGDDDKNNDIAHLEI